MLVTTHESMFTSLSRYALMLMVDKEEKCKIFQEVLNHQIKARVRMLHIRSYSEFVQATLRTKESGQDSSNKKRF